MWQIILTLVAFFGGLFFYALDILTFKVRVPKIYILLGFLLSLIPVVGFVSYLIMYLWDIFNYQKDGFWHIRNDHSLLRDTKVNRYLFDDVDWATYDRCINKIYEQKEEKQEETKE